MTRDPSLKLRVARLENETVSIDELMTDIRATQLENTQRLDRVETRLDGVETELDEVSRRLPEPA
ncbi:hypothetical protein GCM10009798_30170 [Nocardioides panacihumi]|uniref:Uncharacterized protein n=1 Tax=Nocardioides panacihumi TaxID=400774 RepID=A0ABN2RET1_9ACTN